LSIYRNVFLLALAQACFLATSMTVVTFAGLVGNMLAEDKSLATLPMSLSIISTALTTAPMSMLMQRTSRRFGFRLGATFGVLGALLAAYSVSIGSFTLLCVAVMGFGPFQASAQYFRFAAAESVPVTMAPRAISLVLIGGLIAALFAPTLSGWFNDTFDAHRYMGAFIFVAVTAGLVWVPVTLMKPLEKAFHEDEAAPEDAPQRPMRTIVSQPSFIVAVLNGALGYAMMSFVMTATPLAMEICGLVDESPSVIQQHVIAMFLPSLFSGYLIQKLGLLPVLMAGHAAFAVAFLTALSGIQIMQFSVALIALGVGWNFCFVGGTTLLTRMHTASEKGKVQGINEFLVFSTTGLASFAAGLILNRYGWQTVNQAAFALLLVAVVATIFWALSSHHKVAEAA